MGIEQIKELIEINEKHESFHNLTEHGKGYLQGLRDAVKLIETGSL